MGKLSEIYEKNVALIDGTLRVDESFDMLRKKLAVADGELTMYYIDGFVKDTVMQKLMMHFLSLKKMGTAEDFQIENLPYVETEVCYDTDVMIQMVMSGATLMLGSTFGAAAIIIDSREYPARVTAEPDNDRVMRGARDGFVETLIFNTALIRRRVRDPRLTVYHTTVGSVSRTDVALCYMENKADPKYIEYLKEKLKKIKARSLTMGHQSLAECLAGSGWFNPFPKIRCTERPDTAVSQLLEGCVILICDNSPEAMILPTSIFDFMQETGDFYFPPLTGTYLRLVRQIVFWSTLVITPLWYLCIMNASTLPEALKFLVPTETAALPIFVQILLVEFLLDGLKLASMNTPDMLSNSLSVVGGLLLGDLAVGLGWLLPEVILCIAFVAIGSFTQTSYELGYAFKFMRIVILILTACLNVWGFALGLAVSLVLIASNRTVNRRRSYLYPLIPFNGRALLGLIIRPKKSSDS